MSLAFEPARRWFAHLLLILAVLPAFFSVVYGVMIYQAKYEPVITGFTASEMTRRSPTSVAFYGTMNKRFELVNSIPLCRYSNMTWFGTRPGYADVQIRQFTEEHRENGPVSRQTGLQRFGPWVLDYSNMPDATGAYGVVDHWCMWVWPTRTRIGPIEIDIP